jgi:transposase InsO family protein
MDLWAYQNNVHLDFIRPGRPIENGYIESFNGRLRDECLNAHWSGCPIDEHDSENDSCVGSMPSLLVHAGRMVAPRPLTRRTLVRSH